MKQFRQFMSSWKGNLFLALIWLFIMPVILHNLTLALYKEIDKIVVPMTIFFFLSILQVLIYGFAAVAKYHIRNDNNEN